ncbi:MAG TPA: hypothetical protein VM659_28830 [Dongiaceae bacterium]|nr:hypothetical protein [Dongiaceae bacterium]
MTDLTAQEIEELERLEKQADPGPWEMDSFKTDGSFGTGEDIYEGFDEFYIVNAAGSKILTTDTEGDNGGAVEVDYDDDGSMNAWNENSRRNVAFSVGFRNAAKRLLAMAKRLQDDNATWQRLHADVCRQLAEKDVEIERVRDKWREALTVVGREPKP